MPSTPKCLWVGSVYCFEIKVVPLAFQGSLKVFLFLVIYSLHKFLLQPRGVQPVEVSTTKNVEQFSLKAKKVAGKIRVEGKAKGYMATIYTNLIFGRMGRLMEFLSITIHLQIHYF